MANTLNIAVVGESYRRSEQALFLQDLEYIKEQLFARLYHRKSQFSFVTGSWTNKFQCKDSGFFDGGTCNDTKVVAAVNASVPSSFDWHHPLVLSKNLTGGSGGAVCMVGTSHHTSINTGNIGVHEIGHTVFGCQHNSVLMNSSCNNGACAQNATFNAAEFAIINQTLNLKAGYLPSPVPSVTITSAASFTGTTYPVAASFTGAIEYVRIFWNGALLFTLFNWSRAASNIVFTTGGMSGTVQVPVFNVVPGVHQLTVIATDFNNQEATATMNVTVS